MKKVGVVKQHLLLILLLSNVSKTGVALGDEIKRMKEHFDGIIVDTGGRDSKEMRKAMLSADIIIIPTIPSQYDVSVLDHMIEFFENAKDFNDKLIALVLVNRASPNPFLAKDLENLKAYIKEKRDEKGLTDLILLENVIYERQAYKKAVLDGKSISEYCDKKDKAFLDFEQFYKELLNIAEKEIKNGI